jgi:hypothetical protein
MVRMNICGWWWVLSGLGSGECHCCAYVIRRTLFSRGLSLVGSVPAIVHWPRLSPTFHPSSLRSVCTDSAQIRNTNEFPRYRSRPGAPRAVTLVAESAVQRGQCVSKSTVVALAAGLQDERQRAGHPETGRPAGHGEGLRVAEEESASAITPFACARSSLVLFFRWCRLDMILLRRLALWRNGGRRI